MKWLQGAPILLGVVLLVLQVPRPAPETPAAAPPPAPPPQAEAALRERLAEAPTDDARADLVAMLLDSGRPEEAAEVCREALPGASNEAVFLAGLARALLVCEAPNPRAGAMAEILSLIDRVEEAEARGVPMPGGVPTLRLQWTFLNGDRPGSRRLLETARPRAHPAERTDLLMLEADLDLRDGDLDSAGRLLEQYLAEEEEAPLRVGAMWVTHAYLGRPLQAAALPRDDRFGDAGIAEVLARYAKAPDAKTRRSALQRFADGFPPPHPPTCLYGEAVHLPLVSAALHLRLGDLALEAGDRLAAERSWQRALQVHPGDRVVQSRLLKAENVPRPFIQ